MHDGVMYLQRPSVMEARDAVTGQLIWEHKRNLAQNIKGGARAQTIAIGFDMVYWTSPESYLEALDARTGEQRWEAKTENRGATQGAVVAGDKVISGGACSGKHENCFISAHDAKTGKLVWKFMTAAESGQPGGDTWGGLADDKRMTGPWGLSGTYDPLYQLCHLGRRQSHAEHSSGTPRGELSTRFQRMLPPIFIATRLSHQRRHRQIELVLPTSARRRLG